MRGLSIGVRLTLLFALSSTVVLVAVSGLIGYLVDQHFRRQDLAELSGKMALIRHALAAVSSDAELRSLPRHLDDALIGHEGLSVSVLSAADGRTMYSTPGAGFPAAVLDAPAAGSSMNTAPLDWQYRGRFFRGLVARAPTGTPNAAPLTVAVALDMKEHLAFMAAFRETLLASVATGILLTSLLGWLSVRRGLAPIRAIAGVAGGISAERLDDRLPLESVPVELKDLALSFNGMLARLEDSFRRLSEFSTDLAHELRTPVSNLMTHTQVVLSKARSAEEYREVLYSNLEEYDRLARMVSDMLFIAKADNGLIVPRRETMDLAAEIDALIDFYQALADEKKIVVRRSGAGSLVGDRLMIRRALSNLLTNALRHTPQGGWIAVSVAAGDGTGVRVAVENSGMEIPAEHLPRLFDRFYRIDPLRRRDGETSGLGLAIVKSIVEAHGGQVSVASAKDKTSFSLTLPAA